MGILRQRSKAGTVGAGKAPSISSGASSAGVSSTVWIRRGLFVFLGGGAAVMVFGFVFSAGRAGRWGGFSSQALLLSPSVSPTDEERLSASLLPLTDTSPKSQLPLLTCMPTVERPNKMEYVSNAVKSFRMATNGSEVAGDLVVFLMDFPAGETGAFWLKRVLQQVSPLPKWLRIVERNGQVRKHRKLTYGDSVERVKWRSKEAQDYAQVLKRCADMATGEYMLVVQDDVLFTKQVTGVLEWAKQKLEEGKIEERNGRKRVLRVCSGSLFDLTGGMSGRDGHLLDSSNMVARLWKVEKIDKLVSYLDENFDEAPVDWLVDRFCKAGRRVTLVMEPNPVKHRGRVSSFEGNKRDGMLT